MTTSTLGAPNPLTTKRISERGWFIGDGGYNNLAIVGNHGVVLCDAPPSYGPRLMPAIKSITPLPVTHLIYSHEHVDHIAGAGALDPRPEIIATAATDNQNVGLVHVPAFGVSPVTHASNTNWPGCGSSLATSWSAPLDRPVRSAP